MNQDDNTSGTQGQKPDEMEARVMAWVAGEATPEEEAELERLAAEKPEIAALKARCEGLAKLVSESVAPDKEPLRLSKDRRGELLRTLRAPARLEGTAESDSATYPPFEVLRRHWAIQRRWIFACPCGHGNSRP